MKPNIEISEKKLKKVAAPLNTLPDDHTSINHSLRNHITIVADEFKDLGAADFMTGLMEQHEKMARMLRSYL